MFKRNKSEVEKKTGDGLISYILLQKSDVDVSNLLVTWVEISPGDKQKLHQHVSEQVYVIIKGSGKMTVGDEKENVAEGDIIYVPSNKLHGILNTGNSLLAYVSAATPSFDVSIFYGENKP